MEEIEHDRPISDRPISRNTPSQEEGGSELEGRVVEVTTDGADPFPMAPDDRAAQTASS